MTDDMILAHVGRSVNQIAVLVLNPAIRRIVAP